MQSRFLIGKVNACCAVLALSLSSAWALAPGEAEYKAALAALDKDSYMAALVQLDKAVKANPTKVDYRQQRGYTHYSMDHFAEAVADFNWVLQRDPTDDVALRMRAFCYMALKDYSRGIADCTQLLKLNPGDAETLNNRAVAHEKLGKHDLAKLDRLAAKKGGYDPAAIRAMQRSEHLEDKHQWDRALTELESELRRGTKEAELYFRIGLIHFWQERYADCVGDMTRALEITAPTRKYETAQTQLWKARALTMLSKYKEAITETTKGLRIAQAFNDDTYDDEISLRDEILDLRGKSYSAIGAYQSAIADYTTILQGKHALPVFYVLRANTFMRIHEYQKAISDCDIILKKEPKDWMALIVRMRSRVALNQLDGALSDASRLITLNRKDEERFLERGGIYFKLGQFQKAVDDYNTAIKLDPDKDEGLYYKARAAAYRKMGHEKEAVADEQKVVDFSTIKSRR